MCSGMLGEEVVMYRIGGWGERIKRSWKELVGERGGNGRWGKVLVEGMAKGSGDCSEEWQVGKVAWRKGKEEGMME